jgi:hypothetical protein
MTHPSPAQHPADAGPPRGGPASLLDPWGSDEHSDARLCSPWVRKLTSNNISFTSPAGENNLLETGSASFVQAGNRRRELGLPCNAVVHHLAFDAPGVNVLSLTDAVRFRQLERARFTPFVPGELTRTRERSVVRGRKVWAPGDQSRTTQDYPFHVRVSRVHCPKLECAQRCKRRPPAWMSAPADQD